MTSKFLVVLVSALILLSADCQLVTAQEETPVDRRHVVSPRFPGRSVNGDIVHLPLGNLQLGISTYHAIYGVWPESWAEVRSSGIFQTPLYGREMQIINPDVARMDFLWDCYYHLAPEGPKTYTLSFDNKMRSFPVSQAVSYKDLLSSPLFNSRGADMKKYLDDERKLRLFGILRILQINLNRYKEFKGHYPAKMWVFLDSGFGPIDSNSINPVTGKKFRFDGSPGDVIYNPEKGGLMLRHVDEDGSMQPVIFTY